MSVARSPPCSAPELLVTFGVISISRAQSTPSTVTSRQSNDSKVCPGVSEGCESSKALFVTPEKLSIRRLRPESEGGVYSDHFAVDVGVVDDGLHQFGVFRRLAHALGERDGRGPVGLNLLGIVAVGGGDER